MANTAQPAAATTLTLAFHGADIAITYVLGVTSAPPAFDAFGTLTLYDSGSDSWQGGPKRERYVLIQQQHESWQEGRYRSGLFSYERSDALPAADIAARLYKAMTGAFLPEGR
ncbi:MAG TPA: hypothetical protein VJS69_01260 [Candidatus Krumholzibacteria bacterium]|nr:hypothetical protein [Candidatus Krumholzibacteria bacterium]